MSNWTEKQICEWGVHTFGLPKNPLSLMDKVEEEFEELQDQIVIVDIDEIIKEAANVTIVLMQLVYSLGGSLQQAIDDKMDINSMRSWVRTGDGIGKHTQCSK